MRASKLAAPAALVVSLIAAAPSAAQPVHFTANMTGTQENPPASNPTLSAANGSLPRPLASGFASFVLNDARTALSFTGTVNNIDFTGTQTADPNDNLVAAHIHASATLVPTTNAGVVFGFFGAPFNDNSPNDVIITPFASGVGGTFFAKWDLNEGQNTTLIAQLPNILAGRSYINIHTTQFPGGEIRGAIVPVNAVPEPSTLLLLGSGLGAIIGIARVRRRA